MRRQTSIIGRADQFYPWLLFFTASILASLMMAVPWPAFHFNVIMPNLLLIVLFAWILLRPELCQYTVFFVIGIWMDFLLSVPLGVNALGNLLLLFVVEQLRVVIIPRNFAFIALCFAAISLVYMMVISLIGMIFFSLYWNAKVFAVKWLCTNLIFPILFAVLLPAHRDVVLLASSR